MRCVACKDSDKMRGRRGQMWLGGNEWIICPNCNGTAEVPKYNIIDVRTGKLFDSEEALRGAENG